MNPGFALGLVLFPFFVGGVWVAWWAGITDMISGTFYVLALLVGPFALANKVMSDEARAVWDSDSVKPNVIYLIAVAVLAFFFYLSLKKYPYAGPHQAMGYDGPIARYFGCLIWAWAVLPFAHIVLDRVLGFYSPNGKTLLQVGWLDRKMAELVRGKKKQGPPPLQAPQDWVPIDYNSETWREEEAEREFQEKLQRIRRERDAQHYKFDPARFRSKDGG